MYIIITAGRYNESKLLLFENAVGSHHVLGSDIVNSLFHLEEALVPNGNLHLNVPLRPWYPFGHRWAPTSASCWQKYQICHSYSSHQSMLYLYHLRTWIMAEPRCCEFIRVDRQVQTALTKQSLEQGKTDPSIPRLCVCNPWSELTSP